MDPSLRLDALAAPLRADVVSGAAVVGRMAAEVVRRAASRMPAQEPAEFRDLMGRLAHRVLDAQPAMAPLVTLMGEVLRACAGARTVEEARAAAIRSAEHFRSGLEARAQAVASRASALIPEGARVLTVSSSSTVRAALVHHPAARSLEVVCLEGRPMQEGHMLAEALARAGIKATLAVDAAAASLAPGCDLVLMGADSVGDAGLVNKIGTVAAADAARRAGIPVYVVTDESKILPAGFPQHVADDRPGEEVGRAPAGVRVWNRYFELLPLEEVTALVTESGTLSPEEIRAFRAGLDAPEELREWARARAAPDPLSGPGV